jgi:hypothetical protein
MIEQGPAASNTLAFLRNRISRVLPAQIRECLDQLTEEQIWWRPNEKSNSVGNLILHLSGSLNHYLNFEIGGIAYQRDRPQEFAERHPVPKKELLRIFDDMVDKAAGTLDRITVEQLGSPSKQPKMFASLAEDLLSMATHVAFHAGQIVWITKMLREGAVEELWIRTNRELGAARRSSS